MDHELVPGALFSVKKAQLHRRRMAEQAAHLGDYRTADQLGLHELPDRIWEEAGIAFRNADPAGQKSYRISKRIEEESS